MIMLRRLEHEKEHKRKIKAEKEAKNKKKEQLKVKNITNSNNTSSSSKTLEMIEESKDDEIESVPSHSVTESSSDYL